MALRRKEGFLRALRLWAKLALVALLVADYLYLIRLNSAFAVHANRHSAVFYRILNETVSPALIGTVFLILVKPV